MPTSCSSPSNRDQLMTSGYPEAEKVTETVSQQEQPTCPDTSEPAFKSCRTLQGCANLTVMAGPCFEGVCNVLVSVEPPNAKQRPARDIACVIDISGSMGAEATIQDAAGNTESHGLSLLDVAKHGVRTIINTLDERDRLSIVSFDNYATTEIPLTHMNEEGRVLAEQRLEGLQPRGGTNLWTGFEHGLEALRTGLDKDRQGHVMLLTDGIAHDKDIVEPNLQNYVESHGGKLPGIVSTFGFGYGIDSELLVKVAAKGAGSYSFIPDANFVGTVFIHAMSNSVVTMANEAYLEVKPGLDSGVEIVTKQGYYYDSAKTLGGFPVVETDGCFRMNIGSLQYGQTKDIIVPVRVQGTSEAIITASLQYEPVGGNAVCTMQSSVPETADDKLELIEVHRCRAILTEALSRVITLAASNQREEAMSALKLAIEELKSSPAKETEIVAGFVKDMEGQCTEAVSRDDWYKKWGKHFLPSIMWAHKLQQCNNFKDDGLQNYGGELFDQIRTAGDDVFNQLPAPKPSARARAAPVNMAAYNNCYGG